MHGFEVYDAAGNLQLSMTSRIGRILNSYQTGSASGSVVVQEMASGDPFFFVTVNPDSSGNTASFFTPLVSIDKNTRTLSWRFDNARQYPSTIFLCLR